MPNYDLLKQGDVILTSGTNIGIKIGNFLRGRLDALKWTHAALSLGNDQIVEAVETGIRITSLHKQYTEKNIPYTILRCKTLNDSQLAEVAKYCKKRSSQPYDKKALNYFVLNGLFPTLLGPLLSLPIVEKNLNVRDSYFCSELIAEGFITQNFFVLKTDPWKIMPADFLNKKLFNIISI